MAPGGRARAEGRRHPQRPRARRVPDPARRPRTPGLRAHGAAAEQLRRQPQGVAARGPRALLGGALLRAAGRPEPGGHQVLRRGDQVSEGRQGAGSAMGAGEPVRRDGRFPRRPPGLLQADPRVPELRGGGARAAEAERAGELGASCERRCAGVGAPAPLRFGAVRRTSLGRASRTAPHRRSAGAPTPALRAATVLTPPSKDPESVTRQWAAIALGNLGPDARDALPALEQATQDTNALVRARAQEAIRRIRAAGEAEGEVPRSEVAALVALRERPTASARRASATVVAEAGAVSRRL